MGDLHALALAFVDAYAAVGAPLVATATGFGPAGESPDALDARLAAFLGSVDLGQGTAPRRALRAVLGARDRAARELLGWPVAWARLPEPYTVELARNGACVLLTLHGATWAAQVDRLPVFVLREVEIAARAFELGRAGPAQFDAWLAQKQRARRWVLSTDVADVPRPEPGLSEAPIACTFGELVDGLGAELVSVRIEAREAKAA